ncbi:MAG: hypothetical protein ABS939_12360 [Psychrobacillus sp.]
MPGKRIPNKMSMQYTPMETQNDYDDYRKALEDVLEFSRREPSIHSIQKIKDLKELEQVTLQALEKLDKLNKHEE